MKQPFETINPRGYWLSEKLDGCRCFFVGDAFLSRNGHRFKVPQWWLEGMPNARLDGELFAGRGEFDRLVSTIQTKGSSWEGIRFMVFDWAALRQTIEERHQHLAKLSLPPWCRIVPHRLCAGCDDLDQTEAAIVAAGGEGCVLREPGSFYRPNNFLKVKRLFPDLNRSQLD